MILTCQCCGFSKEFKDGEDAFNEGWDAPPHFTQVICCNLCPASFIVLGITDKHSPAHAKWRTEGRPSEFSIPLDENGNPV